MKKLFCLSYLLFITIIPVFAQDSLIREMSKGYVKTFLPENRSFTGEGWEQILEKAGRSNYVLIGEDHLMNEVPMFCAALLNQIKFDNIFCEIDPFSAKIIESKIHKMKEPELAKFVSDYGNTFSFFAMKPELDLLKQVAAKTNVYGLDQILIVADRLICSELKKTTKNAAAAKIYQEIENQSKIHFENFLKDPSQPFYMLTPDFEKRLATLSAMKLSTDEVEIVDKLKLTARIYKQQNHHLRIQLIKSQLMEKYGDWADKKSLFKYGSVHLPKGQSLLDIYDIGNLIHNIADSKFQQSLHIMIVAKSGFQASPFKGFPDSPIEVEGDELKALKPIFGINTGKNWQCIDLAALNAAIAKSKVRVENKKMTQILEGYDLLIVIPAATPAKFAF